MMNRWFKSTVCIIHVAFLFTVMSTAPDKRCGVYEQTLFCLSFSLCNKHCSHQCSKISSFELRNLQILSTNLKRIQTLRHNAPMDTNLRINYYNIEMEGMKPALCGDYFTLDMPIYSIKESKSSGIQFLRKLYFQNYRDVYTHSACNYKCVFGCHPVGYDEVIQTELLIRNQPGLHLYQCDSVHPWVYMAVVIVVFIVIMIFITCFVRCKISSIRETGRKIGAGKAA